MRPDSYNSSTEARQTKTRGRLILAAQTITVEGVGGILELEHPGHKNQESDVTNCTFALDGGVTISLTGLFR
ncbi:MAG: hypothetical protein OEQ47_18255 [Acidimicrobiia bacterium]|nr:hypothetical protein [Acidimicrobiia bacterium]